MKKQQRPRSRRSHRARQQRLRHCSPTPAPAPAERGPEPARGCPRSRTGRALCHAGGSGGTRRDCKGQLMPICGRWEPSRWQSKSAPGYAQLLAAGRSYGRLVRQARGEESARKLPEGRPALCVRHPISLPISLPLAARVRARHACSCSQEERQAPRSPPPPQDAGCEGLTRSHASAGV
jgi:hypothetical protein